jgi:hypothetical protein
MLKLEKKLKKYLPKFRNCLVVGTGFGYMEDLLTLFNTVFLYSTSTSIRAKNLVYKLNFNDLNTVTNIDFIFYDLSAVEHLNNTQQVWYKHRPLIIIEGREVIGRHLSLPLYKTNYRAIAQEKKFHVWKYL